jgi:hypothetical protein
MFRAEIAQRPTGKLLKIGQGRFQRSRVISAIENNRMDVRRHDYETIDSKAFALVAEVQTLRNNIACCT